MLKNLSEIIFIPFLVLSFSYGAFAVELPKLNKKKSRLASDYWKLVEKMQAQTCKPGVMKDFNKKLKSYRGSGFYLPIISNKIYPEVFPELLIELKNKILWQKKTIDRLAKLKRLPRVADELELIQKKINSVLKLQEKVERFNKKLSEEEEEFHRSDLMILKKSFFQFVEKSFYFNR